MHIRSVLAGLAIATLAFMGLSPHAFAASENIVVIDPSALVDDGGGGFVVSPMLNPNLDLDFQAASVAPIPEPLFGITDPFAVFVASADPCGLSPGGGHGEGDGGPVGDPPADPDPSPSDTESSDMLGCGINLHLRI